MVNLQALSKENLQELVQSMFHKDAFSKCGVEDGSVVAMQRWLQTFDVSTAQVKQVSTGELEQTIEILSFEQSDLWKSIFPLPERWAGQIGEELTKLQQSMDPLLQQVYQLAFDALVEKFGATEVTKFLTVQSMAVASYVVASHVAGDEAFSSPVIELYKSGHCIVGIAGDTLFIS